MPRPALRVPLILRAELTLLHDGRVQVFPSLEPAVPGSTAEAELDDFLRRLCQARAWAWQVRAKVIFEGEPQPVVADWEFQHGKFVPARHAISSSLLFVAQHASSPEAHARELVRLVEHIRGYPLDDAEVPYSLRPPRQSSKPELPPGPVGFCGCGRLLRRVHVYQAGQRRLVLVLHGSGRRSAGPCNYNEHVWYALDPILPQPFDSPPDAERDVPMDRAEWRRIVWQSVPKHLGGPFTPSAPSITTLRWPAIARQLEAPQ